MKSANLSCLTVVLGFCVFVILTSGCTSQKKLFSEADVPPSEVVHLSLDTTTRLGDKSKVGAKIISIDGKKMNTGLFEAESIYEISPGHHVVEVSCLHPNPRLFDKMEKSTAIEFIAKPAGRYRIERIGLLSTQDTHIESVAESMAEGIYEALAEHNNKIYRRAKELWIFVWITDINTLEIVGGYKPVRVGDHKYKVNLSKAILFPSAL